MTLSRADVERIADLAALHVDASGLAELTSQIARIIEYVSQLEAAVDAGGAAADSFWLGKEPPQALRPDRLEPTTLRRSIETFAPAFTDGFFVVPRLAAMEDE